MNRTPLEKKLGETSPQLVTAILSDGSSKALRPSPHTRKRWQGIIASLAQLDWTQLELQDAKGVILEIYHNPDAAKPANDATLRGVTSEVKEMILAQREALTWQDKGVQRALDTCIKVMEQISGAMTSVVEMHRVEREHLRNLIRDLERNAAGAEGGDELPSSAILNAMAPAILARLAGFSPAPAPAPNGKKGD